VLSDNPSKTTETKLKIILLSLLIFAASFLLYANTLRFGLSGLDDNNHIHTDAPAYDSKTALIDAFKTNLLFKLAPTPYYRPIIGVSFVIEHKIAGESESFSHFGSVLLHCISCVLLFLFLKRYLFKTTTSFLATMLFAVHPIAIHTVTWIPGRNDSIMFINFILALAFFIEYIDKKKIFFLLAHILFTFFCFCSKESGIILILIFIFYYVTHYKINISNLKNIKKNLWLFILPVLWILAAILFLKLRKNVFPESSLFNNLSLSAILCRDNLNMIFDYYSSIFFLRTPFAALWGKVSLKLYLIGTISILLTVFFAFYKKDTAEKIKMSFYLFLPLLFILPTNLAGRRLWFQGNRMYIPYFAIIVLLSSFLTTYIENKKTKTLTVFGLTIFIVLCGTIAFQASHKFKNSLMFWGSIINESSYANITAYKFHAYALMDNLRFQEAVNELMPIAKSLNFSYDEINYALGSALMLYGDYENAAKIFDIIVTNKQIVAYPVFANIVLAYSHLGNKEKADYYFNMFTQSTKISVQQANDYIAGFANHLNKTRTKIL
jgi:tetratricopeptide (TPR) repeat protein